MKINHFSKLLAGMLMMSVAMSLSAQTSLYVNVADYITDPEADAAPAIQKAIDENPNRVIFFPDGKYVISEPILTPAAPDHSVCLELSNFAIITPADGWNHDEAMIRLGGKEPSRTILEPGSNYYFSGGVLDGRGVAKGLSIDSGRETVVRNTSIKNTPVGIHIKKGSNNNSSDADIHDVNIVGNMGADCIGVLLDGFDNTLSNMRIYRTQVGVMVNSRGNVLRNIHPLYGTGDQNLFDTGVAFYDKGGSNWFDYCYSDQHATAFVTDADGSVFHDCFAYWYSPRGKKHTAFRSPGKFNSTVTNFTMGTEGGNAVEENLILEEGDTDGTGTGRFANLILWHPELITGTDHHRYMK